LKIDSFAVNGIAIDIIRLNTIVVGSGAAALGAASRLYDFGQQDVAIVTDNIKGGTSRNAGSDKQTYYKLTLAGEEGDSVFSMAQTLFDGGAMDGDIALCEAALSTRSFFKLVEIGVPFPHNNMGEYVGYKTDHDPRQRATSAGPLTSRFMTDKLWEQVLNKQIAVFDGYTVVRVLTNGGNCFGVMCLNTNEMQDPNKRYTVFCATNTIYATGGPASLYALSAYPHEQNGAHGFAFESGVDGKNLTEWQYGIASIKFRWNLSGTYQQVLPRYISTDQNGNDKKEFLNEHFENATDLLNAVFLKGYQWPFDVQKAAGSSFIDLCVYYETQIKKRRVWLDYTCNPKGLCPDFSNVGKECYAYLEKSNALFGEPIDRLGHMNSEAIELFKNNGIDLQKELLEISVCAQHNNGGLTGNKWWESNVRHFFPIGEANGSHGVYRPGGTALNSGQCGGLRAAQYIANIYDEAPPQTDDFIKAVGDDISNRAEQIERLLCGDGKESPKTLRKRLQERMSLSGAFIRNEEGLIRLINSATEDLNEFWDKTAVKSICELPEALLNYDLLIAQQVYAAAMLNYMVKGGGSRGSCLILPDGNQFLKQIKGQVKIDFSLFKKVQEVSFENGNVTCRWRDVRQIPKEDAWFENVWNSYLKDKSIR